MEFVKLTEDEKKEILKNLDSNEKDSLSIAESVLQRIAGIYINKAGQYPEMADVYRNVAGTLSDLKEFDR